MTRVFEVVSKASFAVVLRVLCRAEYCCVLNWSSLGVGWCVIFVHCSLFHSLLSSLLPPSECPAGCQSSAAHRPQLPTALSCPLPSAAHCPQLPSGEVFPHPAQPQLPSARSLTVSLSFTTNHWSIQEKPPLGRPGAAVSTDFSRLSDGEAEQRSGVGQAGAR